MALANTVPPPTGDIIVRQKRPEYGPNQKDPLEGTATDVFANYLVQQGQLMEKYPGRVATVNLTAQNAAISSTDMTSGTLTAGFYDLKYWIGITSPGAGGDIILTMTYQYSGVTYTITAATLNSLSNPKGFAAASLPIPVTALTAVTYEVAYASLDDVYDLRINLQELEA